jgi:hypothetical protein
VDNNYLDVGMSKSGFIHTLPSGRLRCSYTDVLTATACTMYVCLLFYFR